jgi:organizing structure protein 2
VKSLIAPDEPLTPGILYVAVATLSGSVLARNRSIVSRALLPAALFALSANHFLPKTTANVRAYASDLEDAYAPGLAHVHETGKAHTAMGVARAQEAIRSGYAAAERGLAVALGRVQDSTGLKVKDASAWGHQTADEVKGRADGVLAAVKERAAVAETEAKTRAAEIVNAVKDKVEVAEKEADKAVDTAERRIEEKKRLV